MKRILSRILIQILLVGTLRAQLDPVNQLEKFT
jgi:hypothetical protein